MIKYLKNWYLNKYQPIVYAISIARSEYDKIGSFITPALLVMAVLKLYFNIPAWAVPVVIILATVCSYWVGEFLIILGVPKKSAELSNQQNPQLLEILKILKDETKRPNS